MRITPALSIIDLKGVTCKLRSLVCLSIALAGLTINSQAQDIYGILENELQSELNKIVIDNGLPGITFSLRLDSIHQINLAAGISDRADNAKMQPDDRMLSGSTGKLFFAAIALKLIEEQELNPDDLASQYLKHKDWYREFPNHETIKVRHLMNHTSGLPRHLFQPEFIEDLSSSPAKARSPEYCVQYLRNLPPVHAAGESWSYSDANYVLLGFIIEEITGRDIYSLVDEAFFTPLGLSLTSPSVERDIPGLTQGYVGPNNPFRLPDSVLDSDGLLVIDPSLEWTGGGFATNPRDLTSFVAYIQESQYLNSNTKQLMRAPVNTANGESFDQGYGLGCFVWSKKNDTRIGHPGFFPGYVTHVEYSLARQYAIAVQVNSDAYSQDMTQYIFQLEAIIERHLDVIDENKILQNFKRQEDCWNNSDLICYMGAYAKDEMIQTVSRGGITSGYEDILKNYQTYFPEDKMGVLHFDKMQYRRITDQYYFTTGRFNLELPGRDEPASGYFSVIMKRVNGWWWIITDHSS